MRLLFLGDMAATGFGTVTMDLGRALLDLGHDVRFMSQNEVGSLPEPFESRTLQVTADMLDPGKAANWGASTLALHSEGVRACLTGSAWEDAWKPEACILLGDFVGTRLLVMVDQETRDAFGSLPTFHYVPVEGVDLPPRWAEMWRIVQPVAMSEFGADEIAKITGSRPPVIYHGVDTAQFHPVSVEHPIRVQDRVIRSKADAKKAIGADPRTKLLFRADRHMPRKRYASLIRALFPLIASRDDVYLLMHCLATDEGGSLYDTLSKVPARVRSRFVITDGQVDRDALAIMYNAADVYVSVSAEGFGLTIAEALACGTPAVGIDYSAVPEVIGPGGVTVPIGGLMDNAYDHFWASVDEQKFGAETAALLDDEPRRKVLGRAAREHVVSSFQWSQAARQFDALLGARVEVAA